MTKRVHEYAKEKDVQSKLIISKLSEMGYELKGHISVLEDNMVEKLNKLFSPEPKSKPELTKRATQLEADKFKKRTALVKAAQRTAYAKAGVQMEGTPLIVAGETQRQADIDELAIRYAGSIELSNVLAEQAKQEQAAKLYQMQAKNYSTAGTLGAGASLLSGLGQTASYLLPR